jgi:hypothetical protein
LAGSRAGFTRHKTAEGAIRFSGVKKLVKDQQNYPDKVLF